MTADEKLRQIAKIFETQKQIGDRMFTSNHARHNLEGALIDMERTGEADEVCLRTVRRVIKQLSEIEDVLGELVEA